MSLNILVEEKSEIERLILILNLGLTYALNKKVISIAECEKLLYSPFTIKKLRQLEIKK